MKRLIAAALLLAAPLFAQPPQRTTKLVTLKYADPNALYSMVRLFGVEVQMNSSLKTMALSGSPENIAAAETAIKQLDVAPKNVELIAYFVIGSNQPNPGGGAVPAALQDVIAQLKNAFAFKEYTMLDTLTLRARTGSDASTTGVLDAGSVPRLSLFSIRNVTVGEDGTIRIDRMHAGVRLPQTSQSKIEYLNTGIDQDVDVKEGQKIVVGRTSLAGPEKALFIVLTAKVVQ